MPESPNQTEAITPADAEEFQQIVDRAQNGDQEMLPLMQQLMKDQNAVELFGNLAAHAQNKLVDSYAEKNLAVQEGLRNKLESLRAELAGPNPSPLERLLAERIALCWLHLHHLETIYAGKNGMALELAMHYQKCIDRAHKRYLSAIKTLATVRKLALPVLQVNIAKKQVNVAGACMPVDGAKEAV
jgi:hypothetical protein